LSGSLPEAFFARPAEIVAPALIGCLLVKRQPAGAPLWGVIGRKDIIFLEERGLREGF
jgi:hypothetical protein